MSLLVKKNKKGASTFTKIEPCNSPHDKKMVLNGVFQRAGAGKNTKVTEISPLLAF